MADVCIDCLNESLAPDETDGVDIWDVVKATVGIVAVYIALYWFLIYSGSPAWMVFDLLVPVFAFLVVTTWVVASLSWFFGGFASLLGYTRMICDNCGTTTYQKAPDASSF